MVVIYMITDTLLEIITVLVNKMDLNSVEKKIFNQQLDNFLNTHTENELLDYLIDILIVLKKDGYIQKINVNKIKEELK